MLNDTMLPSGMANNTIPFTENQHKSINPLPTISIAAVNPASNVSDQCSQSAIGQLLSINFNQSNYCDYAWDGFYCWPPTKAGTRLTRTCEEIFNTVVDLPKHNLLMNKHAIAFRHCDLNGTWLNNWTNYTECLQLLANNESDTFSQQSQIIRRMVLLILFVCSIVSLVLLLITFFIFVYFKSLATCRLRVHRNLALALIIHSLLLIMISTPHLFDHGDGSSYWEIGWLCKLILTLKLYSTLSSINWMFIEGILLHSRITVSIFRKDAPFKFYYCLGWGAPLILVLVWASLMSISLTTVCWTGYAESPYIWIIVGPMATALLINCIFLVNIIRILLTKLRQTITIEINQIRKAIKATAFLFPLLGISHLLFCINPDDDGQLEDAYMIANAFLQSSQGIFVSVLYCFMDSEVQQVLKNSYNRSSLKHGMFSWSRHTSAFRSRSQYASQTSVSYCGNNTFPLETHRLRSDPATPTLSREIELNKVIHKGSPVLNAEAYNVNNDSSRLTSTNCSIDLLNQQKTSGNNRKQPRTTLFKSDFSKRKLFKFRQPSVGKQCRRSESSNTIYKPRTCIVYSSSGEMVRFKMSNNNATATTTANNQRFIEQI